MTTTNNLYSLLRPFSRSILAKVEALSDGSMGLTALQKARFRESISDDIKKCSNFVVPEVSEKVYRVAQNAGVDLFSKTWHEQGAFDKGRKIFHLEHVQPVSAIRELCLACVTEGQVHNTLMRELRVAWILKAEDAELSRLGYRTKRKDPGAAYAHANIHLRRTEEVG